MKRTFIALLTIALVLTVAAPAFAAGRTYGQAQNPGAGVPAGDQVQLHQQDRAQDGTGENCTTDGTCVPPLDGTGERVQSRGAAAAGEPMRVQSQIQSQLQSRDATGAPATAGSPTAQAQAVMMRNAERLALHLNMHGDIQEKLAGLYAGIIEKLQAAHGTAGEEAPE